nr:hypothetical protein [Streptomyces sp. S1D4-11]
MADPRRAAAGRRGFGQLVGRLILLVQDSAPRHQLGVATTAVRFFQTLGNALAPPSSAASWPACTPPTAPAATSPPSPG